MKKGILIFCSIFISINVFAQQEAKEANPVVLTKEAKKEIQEKYADAKINFESKTVDYGLIEHNSDGNRKFTFTNTGTEPLIIKNAKASCGCTVPNYPKGEILPGETGEIKVKYATNRVGKFTKTITLTTNASKKPVMLTIKGEVSPPPKDTQTPEKENEGAPLERK